jgi:leader peptidase (prepilin peptidase)/N-methyltransferase
MGSFINVVSLRYKPGQKLFNGKIIGDSVGQNLPPAEKGGRSHCFKCGKELTWYELIPVISFLIQKGKCRHCGHKLSFQYLIVEFLSGLIFLLVPIKILNFQFPISNFQSITQLTNHQILITVLWISIFLSLLLLSIIDFLHFIIPDQINLFLVFLGIILTAANYIHRPAEQIINYSFVGHYSLLFGLTDNIWINHIFAALLGMVFFGLIIILSGGKAMGWGDFKLMGVLGLIFGWPDALLIIFLSFIVGSLASAVLLIKKKKTLKEAVPFGPFLVAGSTLVFFFGYQIVDGYFKIFSL